MDHFCVLSTFALITYVSVLVLYSMVTNRKIVVLSLADKMKMIEQLDKGKTGKKLAEDFDIRTANLDIL